MKPTPRSAFFATFLGDGVRDANRAARKLQRKLRGARPTVRYYHRVDDPRSYLLATVLGPFVDAYGLDVEVVLVPEPSAEVEPEPQLRADFDVRDTRALAARFGLPFPEPGREKVASRVRTANALALASTGSGRTRLDRVAELSRMLLSGDGDGLAKLADREPTAHGEDVRPALEAGYERLLADGFYSPATVAFEGEAYHGVERLIHLERRLVAEGATDRALAPRLPEPSPFTDRRSIQVYFSFRSPYSYLGLERVARVAAHSPLDVELHAMLPMVMRGLQVPARKRLYIVRDVKREAALYGVPFGRVEDPLGPAIERCLAVFESLVDPAERLRFARAMLSASFARGLRIADDATFLEVAAEAGVGAERVRAAERDRSWRDAVDAHRDALYERGLWGVPSFVVGEQSTFGQDRLSLLLP